MMHLLWMVPALPLFSFLVLALAGGRLSARTVSYVGTAFAGVAAAVAIAVSINFMVSPPAGHAATQVLWTWFQVGGFAPQVALYLDPLSVVMTTVVAGVGFLILVYSVEFMRGEEGHARFFAYMNLFIGAMLILLLADNLLFLLVGWEGVGLSSYLLIGFWYRAPENGAAARKAFIVTRVGDTSLLVGLLVIFRSLGSLNIQETMGLAQQHWHPGSGVAVAAALLILGGALGKSAQLPLQTWLPDAMAGPTPVSALIHAATMVTAGVYLIARTHVLFDLAPAAKTAVAVIGAATLIYGGLCALSQRDIKRVLAYSTISQIGYMFLALGVGAWSAAIFHFMTHAFFKALLFLAAGLVIKAMGGEHDIFKMGGLHRGLRPVFWVFVVGAASLSAVPVVTAGFYSKDFILGSALSSGGGGTWLWAFGVVGALLTSLYAFRLVFLVFFGKEGKAPSGVRSGKASWIPVTVLAVLAVVGGFVQLPRDWGGLSLFSDFLSPALPAAQTGSDGFAGSAAPQVIVVLTSLAGIYLAYLLFARVPGKARLWMSRQPAIAALARYALAGWGFDRLYQVVFARPFVWMTRTNKNDVIDSAFTAIAWSSKQASGLLSRTQTGRLRYYVAVSAAGVLVFVALAVFR
jgi:NADH-quinone oxidoreductase subunit L